MKRRIAIALILGLFIGFNAWAGMVSFYVIETGLSENEEKKQHSELWENALLDIFFDAGHIVTNGLILRLEKKPSGDILEFVDMQEARDFGIEFVLIAQLDYVSDSRSPGEISFFIYNTGSREKIMERKITPRSIRTARDEYDDIKSFVRGLVPYLGE